MIKCSECGYENMDGLDYCDGCGAKLTAAEGAARRPGGRPMTMPPAPSPSASAQTRQQRARRNCAGSGCGRPAASVEAPNRRDQAAHEADERPGCRPGRSAVAPGIGGGICTAKLSRVRGGRKGQEFPLEDGNNLVGRWDPETGSFPEVDLDQDDPEAKISRKHALIRFEAARSRSRISAASTAPM